MDYKSLTKVELIKVLHRRDREIARLERNVAAAVRVTSVEFDPTVDLQASVADHSEPEPAFMRLLPNAFEETK